MLILTYIVHSAFIPPTTLHSLKRRHELSGPDDGEAVLPSRKRSKVGGLETTVQSKSAKSVRGAVKNTASRQIKALPERRVSQSAKSAFSTFDPTPARADAERASTSGKTTRASASIIPDRTNPGLSQAISLNTAIFITIQSQQPEIATLSFDIPYHSPTQEFIIYEDTAEEELENLLNHSTHSLNIFDDESRFNNTNNTNNLGDETVPLPDISVAGTRKTTRTKKARIPLGELDVAQFYPGMEAEEL